MNNDEMVNILKAMASGTIYNYIAPGLCSHLLGREGSKVRMFQMTRPQDFHISPHSHRFNFFSIVMRGWARNHLYVPTDSEEEGHPYSIQRYTPSGFGLPYKIETLEQAYFRKETTHYPAGSSYGMQFTEYHSIEFSEDAIVLFFEGPMINEFSNFLEPMAHGKIIPLFSIPDWMYNP